MIEFSFCSSFLFAPTGELASAYVLSFLTIDLFVSRIELDFFSPPCFSDLRVYLEV